MTIFSILCGILIFFFRIIWVIFDWVKNHWKKTYTDFRHLFMKAKTVLGISEQIPLKMNQSCPNCHPSPPLFRLVYVCGCGVMYNRMGYYFYPKIFVWTENHKTSSVYSLFCWSTVKSWIESWTLLEIWNSKLDSIRIWIVFETGLY